jgi:hypothetical protein
LSGEGSDGRSDLFSLGVILYVMVTGHSPFPGSSATTVCFKVANREPMAASALDMSLPPQIDALISRAIAKNPEDRYQRGAELADDLRMLQQSFTSGSTTTSLRTPLTTNFHLSRIGKGGTSSAPAAAISQAQKVVQYILFKAPVRDLILGAATLVVLVILGAQSKLLLTSPKAATSAGEPVVASTSTPVRVASRSAPATSSVAPPIAQPSATVAKALRRPKIPATALAPARKPETAARSATLDLAVQHQFKDATLFLYVDGNLAITRALHGAVQKKLVVFNGVRGVESETVQVPAGRHVLRIRALSTDQTTDLSKTVTADFVGGDAKSLQVTFEKHNAQMRLTWQ